MPKQFILQGAAVIRKIQISNAARQQLQNLVVKVDVSQVQKALTALGHQIQNVFRPITRAGNNSQGLNRIAQSFNNITRAASGTNIALKSTDSLFLQVLRKASAFRVSTIIINSFFNAISEAITFTIAFDKSLRDINKILRVNDDDLGRLGAKLILVAKNFNLTSEEVAEGAKVAAQAGIFGIDASGAEKTAATLELVNKAAVIAQISTLSFADAQNTLLSVSKQTNSSIAESAVLLTKFAAVEDATAIDAADLAEEFRRAGTSVKQAFGPNINGAIGLMAALTERTKQSAEVIGTFFKTVISRIGGANSEATKALKSLGIEIEDQLTGKIRDPIDLFTELNQKVQGLGDEDVGEILGKVGGVRQAELFKALLETLPKSVGGTSKALEIAGVAGGKFSTALDKADQDSAKLEAQIRKLSESFKQFIDSLNTGLIKPFFDTLIKSTQAVLDIINGNDFGGIASKVGLGTLGALGAGGIINQLFNKPFAPTGEITKGKSLFERSGIKRTGFRPQSDEEFAQTQLNSRRPNFTQQGLTPLSVKGISRDLFGDVKVGFRKFNAGLEAATRAVAPFSIRAITASAGLTILARSLQESENTVHKSFGNLIATFSQLLIFGPKAALAVSAVTATIDSLGTISKAIAVKSGKLRDAIEYAEGELADNFINSIKNLFGLIDKKGARAIKESGDLRERSEKFKGGVDDNNRPDAERLANVFNAIVLEASNEVAGTLNAIRAGASDINLQDVQTNISEKVQELITDELNPERFEQLRDLLKNGEFLKSLDKDVAKVIESLNLSSKKASDIKLGDIIANAVASTAQLKSLRTPGGFKPAISREELEKEQGLAREREKLVVSTIELLQAEQKLFAARTGDSIESLKALVTLEETANKVKEDALIREVDLIKQRSRTNLERQLSLEVDAVQRLNEELAFTKKQGLASSDSIAALEREIFNLEIAASNTKSRLKNNKPFGQDAEDIEKIEVELTHLRLDNLAKVFDNTIRLIEAEKQLQFTRLEHISSIADALLDEEQARKTLAQALKGPQQTDAVETARTQLEFTKKSGELRIAALDEELSILEKVRQTALQARQEELKKALDILKKSPDASSIQGKAAISEVESALKQVGEEQIAISDEISKRLVQRAVLESKLSADVLNGIAKIIQAEESLKQTRLEGARKFLDISRALKDSVRGIFDAQKGLTDAVRSKVDEAAQNIKDKRSALAGAFDQLASARDALIDAVRAGKDSFADYSLEIARATVAADRILGKFFGLREEAGALNSAFNALIDSAARAGASEQKLAELRQQAAREQLDLFTRLLSEQQSKAQKFFLSSGQDRQEFVQGLAAIQSVVGQFQGNIENFRGLSSQQLNQFGTTLISLPQEIRQNMANALDQLPDNVGIAGLSKDQITEILQGGSLGESQGVGIERLSKTIETVATLTRQVAELSKSQLIASQQSLVELQGNVAEAKEQVLIAKNALAQAQIDAEKTQGSIREVTATLNAQIGEYRDEFKAKADLIIRSTADPLERQVALTQLLVDFQREIAAKINNTAGLVGQAGPDTKVDVLPKLGLPSIVSGSNTAARDVITDISKGIQEANLDLRNSIDGLKTVISGNFIDNISRNIGGMERLSAELAKLSTARQQDVKAEINIDNLQKINISGASEIIQQVLAALDARGFVTQEQIQQIQNVIAEIIRNQIESGQIRPGAIFK